LSFTAGTSTTSKNITVSSSTNLMVGQNVVGSGIPMGTTITAISGTTVTLSNKPTATASNVSLSANFNPNANGGGGEEAIDIEWAHALAPGANILVFETGSSLPIQASTVSGSNVISGINTQYFDPTFPIVAVGDAVYVGGSYYGLVTSVDAAQGQV